MAPASHVSAICKLQGHLSISQLSSCCARVLVIATYWVEGARSQWNRIYHLKMQSLQLLSVRLQSADFVKIDHLSDQLSAGIPFHLQKILKNGHLIQMIFIVLGFLENMCSYKMQILTCNGWMIQSLRRTGTVTAARRKYGVLWLISKAERNIRISKKLNSKNYSFGNLGNDWRQPLSEWFELQNSDVKQKSGHTLTYCSQVCQTVWRAFLIGTDWYSGSSYSQEQCSLSMSSSFIWSKRKRNPKHKRVLRRGTLFTGGYERFDSKNQWPRIVLWKGFHIGSCFTLQITVNEQPIR